MRRHVRLYFDEHRFTEIKTPSRDRVPHVMTLEKRRSVSECVKLIDACMTNGADIVTSWSGVKT